MDQAVAAKLWLNIGAWAANEVIAPAIVALIFSVVFVFLLESHRARRDRITSEVDSIRRGLLDMWSLAAKYWTSTADTAVDREIEETIELLESDLRLRAYDIGRELRIDDDALADFLKNIANAVTGGSFKDPKRAPDPRRLASLRVAIVLFREALTEARGKALRRVFHLGH